MRVHLEDEQNLIFEEGMEANAVETAANTELNAFFIINNDENEGEGHYGVKNRPERWVKYVDMPSGKGADDTEFKGYTWTGKLWKPRLNKSDTIGRIHCLRGQRGRLLPPHPPPPHPLHGQDQLQGPAYRP